MRILLWPLVRAGWSNFGRSVQPVGVGVPTEPGHSEGSDVAGHGFVAAAYDRDMPAIRQVIPLGTQWPTSDPFLFCAHHLDLYPAADGRLAPDADLAGREIGQDFAGLDGWNMYHGDSVPGFPQHPHRGFETVTYVRRGWCDHSDSGIGKKVSRQESSFDGRRSDESGDSGRDSRG